jgi:hypothetical protein
MSEKIFRGTIAYLKIVTGFGALLCFVLMFFTGFAPWHSLDGMIWIDLYGSPELPEVAKPAFTLPLLLFCWLSTLTMVLIFIITKYSLARKEKWAFWAVAMIGFFWPLGAALITCYTKAWSYFISAGMMAVLFFPPVMLLFPHFRSK